MRSTARIARGVLLTSSCISPCSFAQFSELCKKQRRKTNPWRSASIASSSNRHNPPRSIKERKPMARYISLIKFTDQGAKNMKKSTTRAHTFDKAAAKAGVKIEGQYWTMGAYDGVLI